MIIKARQIPPECQESPLFREDWPENIFVFGNRDYQDRAEPLHKLETAMEELFGELDDMSQGRGWYNTFSEALADLLPTEWAREYTRQERMDWIDTIRLYATAIFDRHDTRYILCQALELATGEPWDYGMLRGNSQSEWQKIIYRADMLPGDAGIQAFEAEYFNTGTEWSVIPEDQEEFTYSVYCTAWTDDGIAQEIRHAAGVSSETPVILEKFTGWSRTPGYSEVRL